VCAPVLLLGDAPCLNSRKNGGNQPVVHNGRNGGENMDMERFARLADQSNFFKEELVAANSINPAFAKALLEALEVMQFDKPFLSKKYLKGFRNTVLYRHMLDKAVFEAFIDIEWDIKTMFMEDAQKRAEEEAIKAQLNFKG